MIRQLQSFDFRKSAYNRPSDHWVCGYAAEGRPCPLGPSRRGRCQVANECDPRRNGEEWVCGRPEAQGGACPDGPNPDGTCCRSRPRCTPQPSLRRLRGRVNLWASTITVSILLLAFASTQDMSFFTAGQQIQGHGEIEDCGRCHVAFDKGVKGWFAAAFRHDDPAADSQKCTTCHERGGSAMQAHNLPQSTLEEHTRQLAARNWESQAAALESVRQVALPVPDTGEAGIACATCHKEHRGADFDVTAVSNERCQSCHTIKFEAFAEGHPSFDRYPYVRRTRLNFDHKAHFDRNFAESKVDTPPQTCASCHAADPSGRYVVVKPFEDTCAICHANDIEGEGLAGTKGIPVMNIPGLDVETLRNAGLDVGEWPEDAITETIPPFMKLMIAADDRLAIDLAKLEKLELLDLSEAKKEDLDSVVRIAWAIKELMHDFVVAGAETVQAKVQQSLGRDLDRVTQGHLIAQVPLDVVVAAQRAWFPRLKSEIDERRQKQAAVSTKRRKTAHVIRRAPDGRSLLVLAAASLNGGSGTSAVAPKRNWVQLAQGADELLIGNDKLIDKKSLRLDDLDGLLKEDPEGAKGGLGNLKGGGDAASTEDKQGGAAVAAKDPGKQDAPKAEKPAAAPSGGGGQVAQGADELLNGTDKLIDKDSLRLSDFDSLLKDDPEGGKLNLAAPGNGGAADAPQPAETAASSDAPEEEEPAESEKLPQPNIELVESLDPNLEPEAWAKFGGWFRQDFALYYRPVEHKDKFMRSWLDIAAGSQGTPAQAYGRTLLNLFQDKNIPGKCTRCHSMEIENNDPRGRGLIVNWRPFTPDPNRSPFTAFNHSFHFSMVEAKGCGTCHEINPKAEYTASFKGLNPDRFESNFAPMKIEACTECHVTESAGDACVQCHRYHVGEFPIVPVDTQIAKFSASLAAAGADSVKQAGPELTSANGDQPAAGSAPAASVGASNGAKLPDGIPTATPRKLDEDLPAYIHLASHRSIEMAEQDIARMKGTFADLLNGKQLFIDRLDQADRGPFYRLIASPFDDSVVAEAACKELRARRQDCLVIQDPKVEPPSEQSSLWSFDGVMQALGLGPETKAQP